MAKIHFFLQTSCQLDIVFMLFVQIHAMQFIAVLGLNVYAGL